MTPWPPQVHSLTDAEIAWLQAAIAVLPGGWSVAVVRDPAELSAVLLPADGDRFAETFLVERVPGGYRLLACRWDDMAAVGVFAALADSLAHVAAVAAAAARAAPFHHLQ